MPTPTARDLWSTGEMKRARRLPQQHRHVCFVGWSPASICLFRTWVTKDPGVPPRFLRILERIASALTPGCSDFVRAHCALWVKTSTLIEKQAGSSALQIACKHCSQSTWMFCSLKWYTCHPLRDKRTRRGRQEAKPCWAHASKV